MPEGSSIRDHMIHGATNKDVVHQLRHLYCKQQLRNAMVVLSFIKWKKGRHDPRNVDRIKDVPDEDAISGCMDKLNSGAIVVDKDTKGIVVVYGGAKAAGEWVEQVKSARKGGFQVVYDAVLFWGCRHAKEKKTLLDGIK